MNYRKLIENTVIPSTLSLDEKDKRYSAVTGYINPILPSKLYRFRSCTERSLSAFYNDEVWFSNGSTMNDDFDARLYYDKKKIQKWLNSFISKDGGLKVIESLMGMENMPVGMDQIIPNAGYMFNALKRMPKEQINLTSSQLIQFISDNLESELKRITDQVQGMTKFACFTEKIYSDMMWGHYTNNSSGFALEYEFGNENTITYKSGINGRNTIWGNLFPIIYGNQRLDTTAYAVYLFQVRLLKRVIQASGFVFTNQWIDAIVPCPDEFMVTKLAIKKSNDWKPEKEWRMFYTTNDMVLAKEQHSCVVHKPSAVYLGRKISSIHQKIIVDMASEKDIPVFKMDINDDSKTYRLCKHEL